jgi:hypothetical protein
MADKGSCTYCGYRATLTEKQGEHLARCGVCTALAELDAKSAVARLGNMLLRELNDLKSEVRRLRGSE